ncbi:putative leucine-rich repeat receptor-like protein kinase [Arachis hypogaea]|nr:putative leucine-rich repeat receptor-like protein kinase [Arachis hypogaea]
MLERFRSMQALLSFTVLNLHVFKLLKYQVLLVIILSLTVNCSLNEKVPGISDNRRENNGIEINWFFVIMGFRSIMGFGGIIVLFYIYKSWRFVYFHFFDNM